MQVSKYIYLSILKDKLLSLSDIKKLIDELQCLITPEITSKLLGSDTLPTIRKFHFDKRVGSSIKPSNSSLAERSWWYRL